MSQQLISHNSDLKKLRDEGYDIAIVSNFLVMRNIPYVTRYRKTLLGTLVSTLALSGDVTNKPSPHTISFAGEEPCDKDGSPLNIVIESKRRKLADDLEVQFSFSIKPLDVNGQKRVYLDYYEKLTTYAHLISAPALAINPEMSVTDHAPIESSEEESVFNYYDTASSRAEIVQVTQKLEIQKIAVIGLGGTGSYILDFVAKTPVREIHIYDEDIYCSHNAFRSPGAPTLEELRSQPKKVDYFKSVYASMHRGIVAHDYNIDESTVEELKGMDFVFISIHGGSGKKVLFRKLEEFDIPFADTGMGLYLLEDSGPIGGTLRVTTSTARKRGHSERTVSFSEDEDINNEYSTNIQVADLNALNALLAVIKWKKIFGFYLDLEHEHSSMYTIDGNTINNDEN